MQKNDVWLACIGAAIIIIGVAFLLLPRKKKTPYFTITYEGYTEIPD